MSTKFSTNLLQAYQTIQKNKKHKIKVNNGTTKNILATNSKSELVICDEQNDLKYINLKRVKKYSTDNKEIPSDISKEIKCLPVDFKILDMKFNNSGNYLLLQGESKIWCILLPQLRGSISSDATPKGQTRGISCRTIQVGTDLSNAIKFTKILQIEWHPLSDVHVVILTSDNKLSLYNLTKDNLSPEQEFELAEKNTKSSSIVSFAFGRNVKWERFTIFYMKSNGQFYSLCPVVPYNMLFPNSYFEECKEITTDNEFIFLKNLIDEKSLKMIKKDETGVNYVKTKNPKFKNVLICGPYSYECQDSNRNDLKQTTFMCRIPNDLDSAFTSFASINSKGKVKIFLLTEEVRPIWTSKESNTYLRSSGLTEYETIDLELEMEDENATLYTNNSKLRTIFVMHSNAIFQLDFSFLTTISSYLVDFDEDDLENVESTSIHHLVSSDQRSLGICCISDSYVGSYIMFLDSKRNLVCRILPELFNKELGETFNQDYFSDEEADQFSDIKYESLEKIINQTKVTTLPYISREESNSLSQKVVEQKCELLNEEYIQKIELLSRHINTRLILLRDLKTAQAKKIIELRDDLYEQENQRKLILTPKIQDMMSKQINLNDRIDKLFERIQQFQPLSEKENEFHQFMNEKSIELRKLKQKSKK
eukprot:gene7710-12176_t